MPDNKITANIGFEKQIWDAACVLRGNMDASEYKNIVLGLIFLKYISDRFEERYQQLVEESDGFEEDIDEYISQGIFFVPPDARWSVIAANAHKPEIGQIIDDAMRSIEKENKRLKDILPKNFARPELDKSRLGDVVDLFTNIQMIEHGDEKDILGRTYEYCLAQFAAQEGKNAGEFYTPSCVVRTLVEILQPFNGRVYDPCCGSGGMFVQSARFVQNHSGNINSILPSSIPSMKAYSSVNAFWTSFGISFCFPTKTQSQSKFWQAIINTLLCDAQLKRRKLRRPPTARAVFSGIRRAAANPCLWSSTPICCKTRWIVQPSWS